MEAFRTYVNVTVIGRDRSRKAPLYSQLGVRKKSLHDLRKQSLLSTLNFGRALTLWLSAHQNVTLPKLVVFLLDKR